MKNQIIQHYNIYLNDRIASLREMIAGLTEDAKNDAKGSAGDKHETGLAMMHLEQEKLNQKLTEVLELQKVFSRIDFSKTSKQLVLGSLFQANGIYFLMAVALPKIEIADKVVFSVSPNSPLGALFFGKSESDTIQFNGVSYTISSILH